jgi:hypothetical protein
VEDLELGSRPPRIQDETKYMQKLIRAAMAGMMLTGFGMGLAGCTDESSVKTETQVKGSGGTSTITDKQTVKKTGENPPPVPGDNKAP